MRFINTCKNIFAGYISSFLTIILSFISRTIFIRTIGIDYLGINGLFTSVLGVLSLTELGIGTAMNYSLYKPVAENDTEKIKSLMALYKKTYRWIAVIIAVLGIVLVPFLDVLIRGADEIVHVELYYMIFLFNTVSSYFVSYKYSLVNADQQNYILTGISTVFHLLMSVFQIISLVVYQNYVVYLVIQSVFQLFQKYYTAVYLDKLYPFLKEKTVKPLEQKELNHIVRDVKALVLHKIGDISINQTDNIIISAFISTVTVGLVSNYTLITSTVNSLIDVVFNGMTGSLGNLFATENNQKKYEIFRTIDFIGFWIFCFSSVAIFSLIQPFISLMWGKEYLLPVSALALFVLNNYMVGQRIAIGNVKLVSGIFAQDRYLPVIQSIVNLTVSVMFARWYGLVGVYIGTLVSGLLPSLVRPYIVFGNLFQQSVMDYYKKYVFRLLFTVIMAVGCYQMTALITKHLTWICFFIAVIFLAVFPNMVLFLLYHRTDEFRYVRNMLLCLFGKMRIRKEE